MRTKNIELALLCVLLTECAAYYAAPGIAQTVLQGRVNVTDVRQDGPRNRPLQNSADSTPSTPGHIRDGDRNSFPSFTFRMNKELTGCKKAMELSWYPGAMQEDFAKSVATPRFFGDLESFSRELSDSWSNSPADGAGFATFDLEVDSCGVKEVETLTCDNRALNADAEKRLKAKIRKFALAVPIDIRLHVVFSEQ